MADRCWICKERICLLSALPLLIAFTIVQLMGVLGARHPHAAWDEFTSFVLEGALLYFLVTNLVRTRRLARTIFWTLACCAVLMGSVPVVQQLTHTFDNNYGGLCQAGSKFGGSD